ncbi:hypothetical protein TNCV_3820601 [Trichonephila clavipes]|nr:hypothetical protein TNCV_3820601 [Trichonephila clavipes]
MNTFQNISNLVGLLGKSEGLNSNPGEGIDGRKCTVSLRHGDTKYSPSYKASRANLRVRLVVGEERREAPDNPQRDFQNWDGTKPNFTAICMVLKTSDNDSSKSRPAILNPMTTEPF